jgi:hypothetical protein
MATLYVTEYAGLGASPFGPSQAPLEPPIAAYSLAIGVSSSTPGAPNATFNNKTTMIRIHTDAICSISVGVSPTAVATANRMAANQTDSSQSPKGRR